MFGADVRLIGVVGESTEGANAHPLGVRWSGIHWGVSGRTIQGGNGSGGRRWGRVLVKHKKYNGLARPNLYNTKRAMRQKSRTEITEAVSASECFLALFVG